MVAKKVKDNRRRNKPLCFYVRSGFGREGTIVLQGLKIDKTAYVGSGSVKTVFDVGRDGEGNRLVAKVEHIKRFRSEELVKRVRDMWERHKKFKEEAEDIMPVGALMGVAVVDVFREKAGGGFFVDGENVGLVTVQEKVMPLTEFHTKILKKRFKDKAYVRRVIDDLVSLYVLGARLAYKKGLVIDFSPKEFGLPLKMYEKSCSAPEKIRYFNQGSTDTNLVYVDGDFELFEAKSEAARELFYKFLENFFHDIERVYGKQICEKVRRKLIKLSEISVELRRGKG